MDAGKGRGAFSRRTRVRSFAIGVVGTAGAIAAVRRLRRSADELRAGGLGAFEDAPCFLETHNLDGADHGPREAE